MPGERGPRTAGAPSERALRRAVPGAGAGSQAQARAGGRATSLEQIPIPMLPGTSSPRCQA
eukprot:3829577-Pyramimonas_sp.AAC.1